MESKSADSDDSDESESDDEEWEQSGLPYEEYIRKKKLISDY